MKNNMSYLKLKAFKIDQPLASFFVTKIKAEDLLEIQEKSVKMKKRDGRFEK